MVDVVTVRMNATSLHQISLDQFADARKDDDQFLKCWRVQDCGSCLKSSDHCAWCPISGTCVPLGRRESILSPLRSPEICPLPRLERWELRAAPFGCGCSTTTLLAVFGTFDGTLVVIAVLAILTRLFKWIMTWCCGRPRRGVVLEFEDGTRREYVLVKGQRGRWITRWRRVDGLADGEGEPLLR